jgi:hypothetical protein
MSKDITPLVITYNEEANVAWTWEQHTVVIYSGSMDETLNIIRSYR